MVIRLSAAEHVLVVVMHHIVSDGWSMQIIVDEFVQLYRAGIEGRDGRTETAANPVRGLRRVAAPVSGWGGAGTGARLLAGQTRHRASGTAAACRSSSAGGAALQSERGARSELPQSLLQDLQHTGSRQRTTLFVLLLAGFQALLHRRTGQRDARVGISNANRQRPETQGVVGFSSTLR